MVPGGAFMPSGEVSPYVRASFSVASDGDVDTAFHRLGDLLREAASEAAPSS